MNILILLLSGFVSLSVVSNAAVNKLENLTVSEKKETKSINAYNLLEEYKKEINEFDFQNDDFNDYADLLYHDYIQIMYLAKSILSQKGSENKKSIFAQLEKIVQKTNYTKIYDLLERLDSEYPKYCA